jgi:Phosphoserine phosphatase RsbU, N-terminal domain
MKVATRRKRKTSSSLEVSYAFFLNEYAEDGSEAVLPKAYELGRRALAEGKSLLEMRSIHHQALQGLMEKETDENRRPIPVVPELRFPCRVLVPVRDGSPRISACRQGPAAIERKLEEESKGIAYAVHDEAGQLLVAVHLALAELTRLSPLFPGYCSATDQAILCTPVLDGAVSFMNSPTSKTRIAPALAIQSGAARP